MHKTVSLVQFLLTIGRLKSSCMKTIAYLAVSCLTLLFVALILLVVLFIKQ